MIKKNAIIISILFIYFFLITSIGYAKEIGGINMPETMMAGKKKLILNGAGLRSKFFIKVYAGGLYLKKKNHDQAKIINANEPMAVRIHFLRDGIEKKNMINAWNTGFNHATNENMTPIKKKIDSFNLCFNKSSKINDIFDLIYIPKKGISVYESGKFIKIIKGYDFKKALFYIWLGEKPADSNLKKGMLDQ